MKIHVTDRDGGEHELEATNGWRVMEIIRAAGLPITAECGGACACATCHVYVDPDWMNRVEPRGEEENDMLDLAFEVQDNSRLSCQITMVPELDGLRVTLAPE